ncbi:hypothetical protein [Nucisporomicrobium flavum]|uniref:hypothetical protein n=1 Tax=Nucisporomicrobium flavum TaxID=2785915 RepID=UPI0018F72909|nr:hypothetical protein [Nucisporomicrobium flavum]
MATQRNRISIRVSLATALLIAPLGLAACGDDEDGAAGPAPAATTEASPEVGDITDDYFSDTSYVGKTVTVHGTVTKVLKPNAFVLDGRAYGDESLLVISAPAKDVTVGQDTQVTGKVEQFSYTIHGDEFGLADPSLYGDFEREEVLVAGGSAASGTPSASPSSD